MKITIKITKEVIEKAMWCGTGHNGDRPVDTSFNCAVALAARELFPNCGVGQTTLGFLGESDNWRLYADLPIHVRKWIHVFDRLKDKPERRLKWMPEFSFDIDVPSEVVEQIGIGEVYRILSESKTLELAHP